MTAGVVIADDEAGIRDFVAAALTWEGYDAVPAADGREALAYIEARAPALVLTDLQMPVMTGWEVVARVRRAGLPIPVVVMSAVPAVREEAAKHRADGYLAKPFDLDDLLRTVQRFVPAPAP